jgi:hypothetical protein
VTAAVSLPRTARKRPGFPEQLNPVVAPPGWHPQFPGYLYLGFTKATMALQVVGSLAILGLVIARAVSILR